MTSRRFSSVWWRQAGVSDKLQHCNKTARGPALTKGEKAHLVSERKLPLRADADGRQEPSLLARLVLHCPRALARSLDRPIECRSLDVDLAGVDGVRLCKNGEDGQAGRERGEEELVRGKELVVERVEDDE